MTRPTGDQPIDWDRLELALPELVFQVTPRISARVTRALGEPAPGQPPDRTFATLDFRLKGPWSLEAMVGDRGASALDLIWRHRY